MNKICELKTTQRLFSEEEMIAYIKEKSTSLHNTDTLKSLDFAIEKHKGQTRKNCDVPYINHVLTVCVHAIGLGIEDDVLLSACLLHDVLEDCDVEKEELPVCEETKDIVELLSHGPKSDKEAMKKYYELISKNPKAILVKCLDRCNNISTMIWGFSRKKQIKYIEETERDILPLLECLKESEYETIYWDLKYHMGAILDIMKRIEEVA